MENEQLLAVYAETRSPATLDEIVRRNQNLLHHILKRFAYAERALRGPAAGGQPGAHQGGAAVRRRPGRALQHLRHGHRRRRAAAPPARLAAHAPAALGQEGLPADPGQVERAHAQARPPARGGRARQGAQHQRGRHPRGHEPLLAHRTAQPRRAVHAGQLQAEADPSLVHSIRQQSFALPIEDKIALYAALDRLSAFQKRLIYLLFFKDLTQSEVAEEMGLTQKKVSRESIKALGPPQRGHGQEGVLRRCTRHLF